MRSRGGGRRGGDHGKTVWTYAYEIVPPQAEGRLGTIRNLLDQESADARRRAQTWVGRVVLQRQVTHILVVSDSPDQDHAANQRLEAQLKELEVEFSLTAPMAVSDGPSSH